MIRIHSSDRAVTAYHSYTVARDCYSVSPDVLLFIIREKFGEQSFDFFTSFEETKHVSGNGADKNR